jgi:hypothetical protein
MVVRLDIATTFWSGLVVVAHDVIALDSARWAAPQPFHVFSAGGGCPGRLRPRPYPKDHSRTRGAHFEPSEYVPLVQRSSTPSCATRRRSAIP